VAATAVAGQPERRSWDLAPTPPTHSTPGSPELVTAEPLPNLPGQPPVAPFTTRGLVGGLAVAVVAAVLATAIWYAVVAFSSYQIGFVAVAVGWVIGTGAVLGARGRGSIWLSAISVLLTIISLGVSEYLIAYHFVTEEIGFDVGLIQPVDVMLSIILEVIVADPLTLVFWGFAVVAAAYVPFKQIRPEAEPSWPVPQTA
jgi:hypothetical protein